MKLTIDKAIATYRILTADTTRLSKMQGKEKFAVIRAIGHLKTVAENYDTFLREAAERLRPEGHAEAAAAYQSGKPLTPAQQQTLDSYIRALDQCMAPELSREVSVPLTPLSEDGLSALLDSNPELTATQSALLLETLLAPESPESAPAAPAPGR